MIACRVCGSENIAQGFRVREMMFGTREYFNYFECGMCHSLQICETPDEKTLQLHYPSNYYSYSGGEEGPIRAATRLLRYWRDDHELGRYQCVGHLLSLVWPAPVKLQMFRTLRIPFDARILDVGCGSGVFLDQLAEHGFKYLRGVDPFNASPMVTGKGVQIDNCTIEKAGRDFDLVMFNHALEHVPDPRATMMQAATRLKSSGLCIVRIPTSSSQAWSTYGTDWVQLDAPRHIFIPSRQAMSLLGDKCGLTLETTIDDSSSFQFIGSESYRNDIALNERPKRSARTSLRPSSWWRNWSLSRRAMNLNASRRGDQSTFVFRKA